MRSPTFRGKEPPLVILLGLEHHLDQAQYPPVRDSLGDQPQKLVMVNRPKEIFEIRIYDPLPTTLDSTWQVDRPPRVMRATFVLMPVGFTS